MNLVKTYQKFTDREFIDLVKEMISEFSFSTKLLNFGNVGNEGRVITGIYHYLNHLFAIRPYDNVPLSINDMTLIDELNSTNSINCFLVYFKVYYPDLKIYTKSNLAVDLPISASFPNMQYISKEYKSFEGIASWKNFYYSHLGFDSQYNIGTRELFNFLAQVSDGENELTGCNTYVFAMIFKVNYESV